MIPEHSHLFWANVHPGTAPLTSAQPRVARWGSPAESKPIPCAQDAALRRSLGAVTDVWHRYHFMDEGAKDTLKRIKVMCEHRKHVGLTPLHSPGLVDEGRWPHYCPNCGNKDHSAPHVPAVALMDTSTRQACCDAQPHIRPGHLLLMESFIPTCPRGWHSVHGSLGMPIKTNALQWTLQAVVSHSAPWCKHRDGNNPDTAPHAWWVHPGGVTPSPCTHTP